MKYIRDESVMAKTRRFDADNAQWARECLAKWESAGCPEPDGLTICAMRTLRRQGGALPPEAATYLDGAPGIDSQGVGRG